MKKIVHVIPSLTRGGAENVLLTLLKELHTTDEHHIIYCTEGPLKQEFEKLAVTLHKIAVPGGTRTPVFAYKLYRLLQQVRPDILHTILWTPNLWGRIVAQLLKIPCVAALHTVVEHEGKLRTFVDRFVPASPTAYIAVSPTIVASLTTHKKFVQEKIVLIPNGITITRHAAPTLPFATDDKLFIIGSVGRFVTVKQYDLLLKVFAELHIRYSHTRLVLIGYGEQEQMLRTLARSLALETAVHFIINQPAAAYYQTFDCFIQTSAQEGLSLAVLEAMGNGVPVIAPQGISEHPVIKHLENGLLWNSVADITTCLGTILKDTLLAQQLTQKARQTIENYYSSDTMVQNYQKLFDILER